MTEKTNSLLRISVVVCARDRPNDLAELLYTLLNQTCSPFEVIVVDDSSSSRVREVVQSFQPMFDDVEINCVRGNHDGLPAARNLGVKVSRGDAILFLDDDTLLRENVLCEFTAFFNTHPNAVGVQGQIRKSGTESSSAMKRKIRNAVHKALMLFYYEQNKLAVRRSGTSIFPYSYPLTSTINAQRLDGCCMCYRAELLEEISFDTNLKRWAFLEDLDFSYRTYKKNLGTMHAIPSAIIAHKKSAKSRLPSRERVYMKTIYWFYVFFKDVIESSILNLIAFLWALTGNLATAVGGVIAKRKRTRVRELAYLISSYFYAFRHLRGIRRRNLDFFNKQLEG